MVVKEREQLWFGSEHQQQFIPITNEAINECAVILGGQVGGGGCYFVCPL